MATKTGNKIFDKMYDSVKLVVKAYKDILEAGESGYGYEQLYELLVKDSQISKAHIDELSRGLIEKDLLSEEEFNFYQNNGFSLNSGNTDKADSYVLDMLIARCFREFSGGILLSDVEHALETMQSGRTLASEILRRYPDSRGRE